MSHPSPSDTPSCVIGYIAYIGPEDDTRHTDARHQLEQYAQQCQTQLIESFVDHHTHIASALIPAFKDCLNAARQNKCPVLIVNAHSLPAPIFQLECDDVPFILAELGQETSYSTLKLIKEYHDAHSRAVYQSRSNKVQHSLEIRIGSGLANSDFVQYLTSSIKRLRRDFEDENGWIFPRVRIVDDLNRHPTTYAIALEGTVIAEYQLILDRVLALSTDVPSTPLPDAISTVEPAFQIPAFWIPPSNKLEASQAGYTIIEPRIVLTTHLQTLIHSHKHRLYTAQAFHEHYASLQKTHRELLELLNQCGVTAGHLHHLFSTLAKQGIPLKDDYHMLLALVDGAVPGFNANDLLIAARKGLKNAISKSLMDDYGAIPAVAIAPQLESEMQMALNDPDDATRTWAINTFGDFLKNRFVYHQSSMPILICQQGLATLLRELFQNDSNGFFPIFSPDELTAAAPIEIMETFGQNPDNNAQ